jgi:LacI family transcriptional regulator
MLALIVPDITNPFFTLVVHGAEDTARRHGYRLLLCDTRNDLEIEADYVQDMVAHRVAGLLVAPTSDRSARNIRVLLRHNMPFVLIDRALPDLESDLVQGDSVKGARELVEHLIRLGHREIAMITREGDISTVRDRLMGYRQALDAARIPYDPGLVVTTGDDIAAGRLGIEQLLASGKAFTAVFAVNSLLVAGVMGVLRERGIRVPRDMALVCFEDIEPASLVSPFLTVMAQPAETFGTIATQLLLDRIDGRAPERRRVVVLPPDLIARESCGSALARQGKLMGKES